mmetsp:Transcript_8998/g.13529  ORF Transcript_8998/g.13529 Transcript_8998/m.13529 type:complete len:207 (+) Transcript_8998:62-682(+)
MSDFVSESQESELKGESLALGDPLHVQYCPKCTLPPEYCEYGPCFEECLPWIAKNMPEVLSEEVLAQMVAKVSVDDDGEPVEGVVVETEKKKKSKRGGGPKLKKATVNEVDTRVVIAKVQRQKRKFVTVVAGLETVPGLKIKDASKAFGKKFSSGSSINEGATGAKEVVIQGDVSFDLPSLLVEKFNVDPSAIFFLENGSLTPFQG